MHSQKINQQKTQQYLSASRSSDWPELTWSEWHETSATLHLWFQVIGKIKLALAIPTNHWWHCTLYPTCRGLTTSPMPYGARMLQIDFDFLSHELLFQTSDGLQERLKLEPMTVADFYARVMDRMDRLSMPVVIDRLPSEMADPIPLDEDTEHRSYDAPYAARFWQALLQIDRVFTVFRSRFIGKVSPVQFFWGGLDLAVTRFSGRRAPLHGPVPNIPDFVVQEAYSHEVSSCGFWPGGEGLPEAIFYAYAYPSPPGFKDAPVQPAKAYFHEPLQEFILPYEAVRQADNPDACLLEFLQSTYEAAANLAEWDRAGLETTGGLYQSDTETKKEIMR